MNLKKCPNGHYYDGDTYGQCPHCQSAGGSSNETIALGAVNSISTESVTVAMDETEAVGTGTLGSVIKNVTENTHSNTILSDDQKTISFFSGNEELAEKEPVVGWLVCVKGGLFGEDFRLKTGRNFIGRSASMDVCLRGEMKVSRDRHAIIVFEPKKKDFLAMPGETKELVYLNGDVVLTPTKMQKNDILQVGDVLLMLIPFCDDTFDWKDAEKLEV